MAADPGRPPGQRPVPPPLSRRQVDLVVSRSVAVFGLVFGLQAVPALLAQAHQAQPLYLFTMVPALYGWLVVVVVCSFARRWVQRTHGVFPVLFLAALVAWPFAIRPGVEVFEGIYWLNFVITVATAMAAVAYSTALAAGYLALVSAVYGVIRITPYGGGAEWSLAVIESLYGLFLGAAVLILVVVLRRASDTVDAAQSTALESYGHAVRQYATEQERVRVDAIVHDSVLTTLLSAARAYTPEAKVIAATMAGNAIGHLRDASSAPAGVSGSTPLVELSDALVREAQSLGGFEVRGYQGPASGIPTDKAEVLAAAAVQAMVNSRQHAGEADRRWLHIDPVRGGVRVVVGDDGPGFDPDAVPAARLGVRVSILERVRLAGGEAGIDSAPGRGTVVTVCWPGEHDPAPEFPGLSVDAAVLDDGETPR